MCVCRRRAQRHDAGGGAEGQPRSPSRLEALTASGLDASFERCLLAPLSFSFSALDYRTQSTFTQSGRIFLPEFLAMLAPRLLMLKRRNTSLALTAHLAQYEERRRGIRACGAVYASNGEAAPKRHPVGYRSESIRLQEPTREEACPVSLAANDPSSAHESLRNCKPSWYSFALHALVSPPPAKRMRRSALVNPSHA
jgi:hypothetical protein